MNSVQFCFIFILFGWAHIIYEVDFIIFQCNCNRYWWRQHHHHRRRCCHDRNGHWIYSVHFSTQIKTTIITTKKSQLLYVCVLNILYWLHVSSSQYEILHCKQVNSMFLVFKQALFNWSEQKNMSIDLKFYNRIARSIKKN